MDHFRLTGDIQYLTVRECVSLSNRFRVEHASLHQGSDKSQISGSPHEEEESYRWLAYAFQKISTLLDLMSRWIMWGSDFQEILYDMPYLSHIG